MTACWPCSTPCTPRLETSAVLPCSSAAAVWVWIVVNGGISGNSGRTKDKRS